MKKYILLVFVLFSQYSYAGSSFSANLVQNGAFLLIRLSDDHFIPPFEAGDLWKIMKGSEQQLKIVRENELEITCNAFTTPSQDTVGTCSILMPYGQFIKIGKYLVFKGEGQVAARLNRHFIDSAYFSAQGNQVYLSSYNTRRLFYFGINEDLIQR